MGVRPDREEGELLGLLGHRGADLGAAVKNADAVFIAVGTPSRRGDGHADLTYVYDAAREIAVHYGFRRWPAFVILADGQYVGVVDGLRNWDEYLTEVSRLLDAAPTRPPTIGIAVKGGDESAGNCHA